ncbi:hypothetical protein [Mesorhizobium prunaredense]|uniref:hypothetical protein n=1 Tax=Mesorhizobium prunaredense TaxID=1631249 RepID=UPI00117EE708|nr:hypothetical protein [Mesorhizobium prunaredense]
MDFVVASKKEAWLVTCKMETLLAYAAISCVIATGSAAQGLRDVGWTDTYFNSYRSAFRAPGAAAAEPGAGPSEPSTSIVWLLPVLGILGTGENAPGATAGPIPTLKNRVPDWPACTTEKPQIKTVPETVEQAAGLIPGSWYVRTINFGCIKLVLEGNRNEPDPAAAPAGQVQESGTTELNFHDENAGTAIDPEGNLLNQVGPTGAPAVKDKGTPVLTVTLGNLPYSLTVDCVTPESRTFCNSESGLRALGKQLVVIAGDPTK